MVRPTPSAVYTRNPDEQSAQDPAGHLSPPVCAFIQVGFSLHFLINIVLTLLGGLPGMVHALWLVVSDKRA